MAPPPPPATIFHSEDVVEEEGGIFPLSRQMIIGCEKVEKNGNCTSGGSHLGSHSLMGSLRSAIPISPGCQSQSSRVNRDHLHLVGFFCFGLLPAWASRTFLQETTKSHVLWLHKHCLGR